MNHLSRRAAAFTLIELVTVIVIIGILSVVAIPVYLDYSRDAKSSTCKGALGGMRAAVRNFYAFAATDAGGGTPRYPTYAEFTTIGTVMNEAIPPNPYDTDGTPNNVVDATGVSKGTISGSSKGWCYDPTTGNVWANSNTKGISENTF
ncbi:MAG: prepilin-type N-terminal cleavage/methylation domain-containing protein [Phycisphaerae bacterium]|nr:prepilin-type N-terminal cleavage/methylation domain-containing protein [Phycisphaerae bacterium]